MSLFGQRSPHARPYLPAEAAERARVAAEQERANAAAAAAAAHAAAEATVGLDKLNSVDP